MDQSIIYRLIDTLQQLVVAMVEKSKSGHLRGAMGGALFIGKNRNLFLLIYVPTMPQRQYGTLSCFINVFTKEIERIRLLGSTDSCYAEQEVAYRIEIITGPFGQGQVKALGVVMIEYYLAATGKWFVSKTYKFIWESSIRGKNLQRTETDWLESHLEFSSLVKLRDLKKIHFFTSTWYMINRITIQKSTNPISYTLPEYLKSIIGITTFMLFSVKCAFSFDTLQAGKSVVVQNTIKYGSYFLNTAGYRFFISGVLLYTAISSLCIIDTANKIKKGLQFKKYLLGLIPIVVISFFYNFFDSLGANDIIAGSIFSAFVVYFLTNRNNKNVVISLLDYMFNAFWGDKNLLTFHNNFNRKKQKTSN